MNRMRLQRLTALATVVVTAFLFAGPAAAQILWDGNILWNNKDNTLSGQYRGSAGAGAPACPGGFSAEDIGTVNFINNFLTDPLLSAALDLGNPDFQPAIGSSAYQGNGPKGYTVEAPADGFFENVCYTGAVGPDLDWTQGWTYYDSTGIGRTIPNKPPAFLPASYNVHVDRTLFADTNYVVRGAMRVKSGVTLTVEAGTWIFEESATTGTIIIERGGKIIAIGTANDPIVITTDLPPGQQAPGSTGGLVINGYARTNVVNSCSGDSAASEGGDAGFYGGNDDTDNSGTLRYVRVEYAGNAFTTDNELNAFTFNAVGSGTDISFIQAHQGKDDLIEFFGGTAQLKHAVATDGLDDGFDWQMGYRGKAQFVVIRQLASSLTADAFADNGIEADNNENNNDELQCSGRSNPTLANLTMVGDRRSGPGFSGVDFGVVLRRGTAGSIYNSIIYNWKDGALDVNGDATFQAHCADTPARPVIGSACNITVDAPVLAEGSTFFTRGFPNPFRSNVSIRFALPQAGHVKVDLYNVNGSRIVTLADGEMPAGENSVQWQVTGEIPNGVYFYKVIAAGHVGSGKVLKVR
jgi:hypothetical protein